MQLLETGTPAARAPWMESFWGVGPTVQGLGVWGSGFRGPFNRALMVPNSGYLGYGGSSVGFRVWGLALLSCNDPCPETNHLSNPTLAWEEMRLPRGSKVVPFWVSFWLGTPIYYPKRNYFGALGYKHSQPGDLNSSAWGVWRAPELILVIVTLRVQRTQ